MSRLIQEIQQEYTQLAGQLGQAVHQAEVELPLLIKELKDKITGIKVEHQAAVIAQASAAAAAPAVPAPQEVKAAE